MPNDRPFSIRDHSHAGHPRIGVGFRKIDLFVVENVLDVPAPRGTCEQREQNDDESKEEFLHDARMVFQNLPSMSMPTEGKELARRATAQSRRLQLLTLPVSQRISRPLSIFKFTIARRYSQS